ncbi:MAG: dihydropteroate synthase [Ignavibacteriae bacterium]|nr:dihydropteroate synthase [Ignavibacteriota bacterium]
MGIVNVTPDSFSDGGRLQSVESAVEHGLLLAEDGADVLDVGGESTRPGAQDVSVDEELRRVIPVVEGLSRHSDVPISVDTRKAVVADEATRAGARIINDVSALRYDRRMVDVVAARGTALVLMHMKGEPGTMQDDPRYADVVSEVEAFFRDRLAVCAEAGITDVWLDPGIGFGKRLEDNLALLRNIERLAAIGRPILVGTSRKRFLGAITGREVGERLPGTIASCLVARRNGARMLRVHDVRAVRDALLVEDALLAEAA